MAGEFVQSGIEAVVKGLDNFLRDVGKMDSAIQGVGGNTKGLTDWNNSITSVTANVTKVVAGAAAASTAAIGAFVADSTKKSADLESSLSGIAAVLNKGTEAVGPLKDLILDLGIDPDLKVSATEAADAVSMLARNGLDMTEIMDGAARSTVLLANATGADFGTAADIATDAMAIFNIQAKDMDQAVNGITGVTTASKFSIDDYKLALAQAGGVAGAVGVSFDDFNTTIAGIAPLFASGSDAGTSFKTFLQRLIPASQPATDAMRDLGLFTGLTKKEFESAQDKIVKYKDQLAGLDPTSKKYAERSEELRGKIAALESSLVTGSNAFFDANGAMKDMDEIAGILNEALSGLSEEKKNDALATIFGTDAMRAAVGVAELGAEGYRELGAQIAEIDAGNQAKTRMDNLSGSMEILSGIVETLQIRIGDKFNPIFRGLVDQVSDFLWRNSDRIVEFFGKLADMVKVAADRFVPLVESWLPKLESAVDDGGASIGGMIDKVGEVIRYIGNFISKVQDAVTPVINWVTENYTLEDILNGITTVVLVSLIPAITSLVTTIGPVIALFGSIVELSSRMSEGQKQFAVAVGVAVFALPPLISAIGTVTGAISAVIGVGSSLVGILTGGGGVVAALGALLNPVGLVVAAVAGLGLAWATDFGGIRTKTTEVVGDVSRSISQWSSDTSEKFKETQGNIGRTLASWSENIGTTLSSWSKGIGTTFSTMAENVIGSNKKLSEDSQGHLWQLYQKGEIGAAEFSTRMRAISAAQHAEVIRSYKGLSDESLMEFGRLARDGGKSMSEFGSAITRATGTASSTAKTDFNDLSIRVVDILGVLGAEAGGEFLRMSQKLGATSRSTKDGVVVDFIGMSGNIGGLFTRLKDSVVGDNKRLTDDSLKEFGRLAAQGGTSMQQLKDTASRLSGESSTVASGNYRALTNDSVASLARLFSEGSGSAQRLSDVLKNQSSGASGAVKSNFYNLASDALSSLSRLQNEGTTVFTRLRENATNKAGEMVRDIPARLRELVDAGLRIFDVGKWVQAGADIIGGVMTGLARAATAPLRWIENFAAGLIGLFTSKLKIASPSQVFDEFGVNIMEGLEGGLESRGDGVLSYMNTFSNALVATTAEAQRQADKNFAKLTESATAAYNGYAVIAGDMAKLSQAIDQNAIAAAEAARKAAEAAKQAEKDKAAAEVAAVDKYFGFGRVSELIDQIKGIVSAAFEVNGTAVRSLGVDLSGLTTSSATNDAIARLQLLAGTIQQNAGAATNVDDRNRLSSLYSDVSGRLLPLLRNRAQEQKAVEDRATADAQAAAKVAAEEAAAKAAAEAAAKAQTEAQQRAAQQVTSSYLLLALNPVIEQLRQLGQFGANLFFSSSEVAGFDSTGRAAFAQADQRLEETISYMLNNAQSDLTSLSSFSAANNAMSFLADALAEIEENLGRYSNLSFLGLNQADVSSRFGDIYGAYNLLSAALPVLSGTSTTVNTSINTGNINNGMDAATLQAMIEQAVANALP